VLVIGLDGATFDVIHPLAEAGRLPVLSAWMREGTWAPLRSTTPAMTFPAWSSLQTGLAPGRHGLFDFTQKVPGRYRVRFTNASDRRGATIYARTARAGGRVLALGMPATWPPEPVPGLVVCGFDAPVSTGTDARMASDPGLYRELARRVGPWMQPDLDEGARAEGWHERAVDVLAGRVERKTAFAIEALRALRAAGRTPALATVVFSESDTVCHHFWRDHDPGSPRHDPAASAKRRGAVAQVYARLDAACGALREAFGPEAACIVVSDHGAGGAARRVVHLNRHLEACGLLARRRGPAGAGLDGLARRARDTALRALPPRAAQALFRRVRPAAARVESAARFGGLDWRGTVAFSEEANTQPGVWINLRGREAAGCVDPADYERVRSEVIQALTDWTLPDGEPVIARVRRREEVYEGPFVERAPDLVVETGTEAGYGLSLVPTPWAERPEPLRRLEEHELAGGRGRGMNGVHRPDGIWIATGALEAQAEGAPRPAALARPDAAIPDAAPTILNALGVPWDEALDGVSLLGPPRGFDADEEARVAERLRGLGYLE
jgi:predicted AlkP superfamily phosphohydrolase/phosphomutase